MKPSTREGGSLKNGFTKKATTTTYGNLSSNAKIRYIKATDHLFVCSFRIIENNNILQYVNKEIHKIQTLEKTCTSESVPQDERGS